MQGLPTAQRKRKAGRRLVNGERGRKRKEVTKQTDDTEETLERQAGKEGRGEWKIWGTPLATLQRVSLLLPLPLSLYLCIYFIVSPSLPPSLPPPLPPPPNPPLSL